jgi:hypothetical protein
MPRSPHFKIFSPDELNQDLLNICEQRIVSSCRYRNYLIVARHGVNNGPQSKLMQTLKKYVETN